MLKSEAQREAFRALVAKLNAIYEKWRAEVVSALCAFAKALKAIRVRKEAEAAERIACPLARVNLMSDLTYGGGNRDAINRSIAAALAREFSKVAR